MKHIISFYSHRKPKLVIREEGVISELQLEGHIDFELSFNRYCKGYRRVNKDYPCPDQAVSRSLQCRRCRGLELSCASCRGDECLLDVGGGCMLGEHHIYIASFGEKIKVGVTRRERLNDRLVEQGADFGVSVAIAEDGLQARMIESLLQHQFGFRNSVRTSEKFKLLATGRELSKQSLENAIEQIEGFPKVNVGGIIDLSPLYPTVSRPKIDCELRGDVIGAKGKLLFLRRDGIKALDMGKISGRYVRERDDACCDAL
ncbi:MAG: DUF2797 domain-containing protein [Candidatus Micrarchaeota archaeon]